MILTYTGTFSVHHILHSRPFSFQSYLENKHRIWVFLSNLANQNARTLNQTVKRKKIFKKCNINFHFLWAWPCVLPYSHLASLNNLSTSTALTLLQDTAICFGLFIIPVMEETLLSVVFNSDEPSCRYSLHSTQTNPLNNRDWTSSRTSALGSDKMKWLWQCCKCSLS